MAAKKGSRAGRKSSTGTRKTGRKSAANDEPTVGERLATRAGFIDDTAPLGDPDAPQGSGPETNTQLPENRPAPAGKIRMADDDK